MVHLDGHGHPGEDDSGGLWAEGRVLSAESGDPTTEELLVRLRAEAGDAPLPPLRLALGGGSTRGGLAGRAVDGIRGLILRLISPTLSELLSELERDRHRTRAELAELRRRIAELESGTTTRDD
ncbi:MAG: hypothetical protein KDC36_10430 [Thermoleophilia bacterium]|nr:hypothetical protein [Thermoleophilia bacterium]